MASYDALVRNITMGCNFNCFNTNRCYKLNIMLNIGSYIGSYHFVKIYNICNDYTYIRILVGSYIGSYKIYIIRGIY